MFINTSIDNLFMSKSTRSLLISPSDRFLTNSGDRPSLGIGYLAAFLEKNDYHADLKDMNHTTDLKLQQYIQNTNPDIIGISMTTPQIYEGSRIAKLCREVSKATLVAGGAHPSAVPYSRELMEFDKIVVGEGERAMLAIARNPNGNVHVVNTGLEENIDNFPPPNRSKYPMEKYTLSFDGRRATPIITSRGCPYACVYCGKQVFQKRFRGHSPDYVIDEIKELYYTHRINGFIVYDDIFTFDEERVLAIADKIKESSMDIRWRSTTRANRVNPNLLKEMREAGCTEIAYGIESGSDEILKHACKGETTEHARQAVKWTREAGMKAKGYFIVGLPFDTKETVRQTIRFAHELDCADTDFYILAPFPATQIWNNPEKYGLEIDKETWDTLQTSNGIPKVKIKHKNLTEKEIIDLWLEARRSMRK
jgi:radical SAM superfamily enzyme YgiQ (UPF0313 family)